QFLVFISLFFLIAFIQNIVTAKSSSNIFLEVRVCQIKMTTEEIAKGRHLRKPDQEK
ncbi:hypothetical protein ILYODFUR_003450, partial [Ilyodon furcidens]